MRYETVRRGFFRGRVVAAVVAVFLLAPAGATQAIPPPAFGVHGRLGSAGANPSRSRPVRPGQDTRGFVTEAYGKLPLFFEPNQGQTDVRVKFLSRSPGYRLFLTSTGAEMVFSEWKRVARGTRPEFLRQAALRTTFVGANPSARMAGLEKLAGKVNYLIGTDPKKWVTGLPAYAQVRSQNLYPGVDVLYRGSQRRLEYDLVVGPAGDPNRIVLGFQGADRTAIDSQGDLVLHTPSGVLRLSKPVIYQQDGETRRLIAGRYALRGPRMAGFTVGAYDHRRPLIIDPTLSYATFLGGGGDDSGQAIAVDSAGNAYVTGFTNSSATSNSPAFPTTTGQTTYGGGTDDAFVTKFNPTGTGFVYSTYLGGSGRDQGLGIAVDSANSAYVTGGTSSRDFPTTPGAFQTCPGTTAVQKPSCLSPPPTFVQNAFVTKLTADGSGLVYSTYLGGSKSDKGFAIAVDSAGNAYVTGGTNSLDFPTMTPEQPALGVGATGNAFVTKLNPSGSGLVYSTYLGGSNFDEGHGIAVMAASAPQPAEEDDPEGWSQWSQTSAATVNAFVTGTTFSPDFPTTPGAFEGPGSCAKCPTNSTAFVTQLTSDGTGLVYSTYLGAGDTGSDSGQGIAVTAPATSTEEDPAYVTGSTNATDFPTTPGAFESTPPFTGTNGFVAQLNAAGTALVYSTYLGASGGPTFGQGIAVTAQTAHQKDDPPDWNTGSASANAYVTGFTESSTFPTTAGGTVTTAATATPPFAFVAKLNPAGSDLVYFQYLGGSSNEGKGIAVDTFQTPNAYIAGIVFLGGSADFPVTPNPGAAQSTYGGGDSDAFAAKIAEAQMKKCPDDDDRECDEVEGGGEVDDDSGAANDDNGRADSDRGDADFSYKARHHHKKAAYSGQHLTARRLWTLNTLFPVQAQIVPTPPPLPTPLPVPDVIEGVLQYVNHSTGTNVLSTSITSLDITGNAATIAGTCTNREVPCLFTASVTIPSVPGLPGLFTISISGGPTEGGTLLSGSLITQILQGL